MTKKSKELSEEDKVTTVPKKGTKGKKVAAETLPVSEEEPVLASVPEKPKKAKAKAVAPTEVEPIQEESTPIPEASPLEVEENVVEEEEQVAVDLSGLSKVQLLDLLKEKLAQG
ncbi:MAG: hypothetical protein RLZZ358_119, partial [Bacteroidota bacterium]